MWLEVRWIGHEAFHILNLKYDLTLGSLRSPRNSLFQFIQDVRFIHQLPCW